VKSKLLHKLAIGVSTVVMALGVTGATVVPASAHGCTHTLGYYKNNLDKLLAADPNLHIPFPATGATQQDKLASAVSILSYSGSDPVAKLKKQFMASALTLANDFADMDGTTYSQYLAAQTFLQNYDGHVLSAAEKTQVLNWATRLDNYNNGLYGPPECS
jgi:hypothetical protein